ncbi:DUF736 domain-containing protein [Sphingomonas sp. 2378]|uniref:DUF736 domain-containing protein n=1 Tax=Sphingomonas sp. 2378 TaxID=1219748 RepID=UPI00311AE639
MSVDVIGRFKPSKQGGWEGRLHTLTLDRKIRIVPNDSRPTERAPTHLVLLGWSRCGEAWSRRSKGEAPRDYLRVVLRDPAWPTPLSAMLFVADDGTSADLAVIATEQDHGR